jgi:hypothetical protein
MQPSERLFFACESYRSKLDFGTEPLLHAGGEDLFAF